MRALRLAVPPLLLATTLVAQSPTPSWTTVPPSGGYAWSVFFDPGAPLDGRPRLGVEARVVDGWTLNVAASRARTSRLDLQYGYFCGWFWCEYEYRGTGTRHLDWSVEVAVRHYPVTLAFDRGRSLIAIYVAGYIGYYANSDERWAASTSAGLWTRPAPSPDAPLSAVPLLPPSLLSPPATQRASSWDGGAQLGVRLMPRAPVFVDVTGSCAWVTIGRCDARLAAAVGVGW